MTATQLEASHQRAERVTAEWARSFHFASRFLPPAKRRAIFAVYDYCRYADNLVDQRGPRPVAEVRRDLSELRTLVAALHAGEAPRDPRWLALHDTLRRYPVPLQPLLELLDGVEMDLGPVAMPDFATLETYCRWVAGGVGLMVGAILGATSRRADAAGIRLGIAMQLTNVLRDVAEDLALDRVYLPADELAQWGLSRADLERCRLSPTLRAFLAFQVSRAREYFRAGDLAVPLFPDDGSRLTVRLLQQTYAGILDQIERQGYDVFRSRAYVSLARKLIILGQAALRERAGRRRLVSAVSA